MNGALGFVQEMKWRSRAWVGQGIEEKQ